MCLRISKDENPFTIGMESEMINIYFFFVKATDSGVINCFYIADAKRFSVDDGRGKAEFNEKSKSLVLFARHGHP